MGDAARWFDAREFACPCCGRLVKIDPILLVVLDAIRWAVGKPVLISSGCRCQAKNTEVGGDEHSHHMDDPLTAVDIIVPGMTPDEVLNVALRFRPWLKGFGLYKGHVHIDTHGKRFRKWGW